MYWGPMILLFIIIDGVLYYTIKGAVKSALEEFHKENVTRLGR